MRGKREVGAPHSRSLNFLFADFDEELAALIRTFKPSDALAMATVLKDRGAFSIEDLVVAIEDGSISKDLLMKAGARDIQAAKFLRAVKEAGKK